MENLNYYILIEGSRYPTFHTTVVLISLEYMKQKINILFDAGFYYDAELLQKNLKSIGFLTDDIHYIVISHWHIDHCGGLVLLNKMSFNNCFIVISIESMDTILKALEVIEQASKYKDPVMKLTNLLIENRNIFGWPEDVSYAKIRAVANLTYRTYDCWMLLKKKLNEGKILTVTDSKDKNVFDYFLSVKLLKISYHTKGDLMLMLTTEKESILVAGDVFPYEDYQAASSLSIFDLETNSVKDENILSNILTGIDLIIPGHGRSFYNK